MEVRPELAVVARAPGTDAFEPNLTNRLVVGPAEAEETNVQVRHGRRVHLPGRLELDHQRRPQRNLDGRAVKHGLGREVPRHAHAGALVLQLPARDRRVVTHLLREHLYVPDAYPVRLADDAVDRFLHAGQGERALGAPAGALLRAHRFHVDVELPDAEEPLHGGHSHVAHRPPRRRASRTWPAAQTWICPAPS